MLRLAVDTTAVGSASVPVRWCVGRDVLEDLKQEKVTNPYLLIVVVAGESVHEPETRYLVPLEQELTYVSLLRSGKNRIFAMVVWDERGRYGPLWDEYLSRRHGHYRNSVLRHDRAEPLGVSSHWTSLDVEVPRALFAKEPPAWEKKWVNRYFRTEPLDQCHYRRRRLFAYTVQPPLVAGVYLFWTLVGFLGVLLIGLPVTVFYLGIGVVRLNYKALFTPSVRTRGPGEYVSAIRGIRHGTYVRLLPRSFVNFTLTNAAGDTLPLFFLWPLAPIFPLLAFTILWLSMPTAGVGGALGGTLIVVGIAMSFLGVVNTVISYVGRKLAAKPLTPKELEAEKARREQGRKKHEARELEALKARQRELEQLYTERFTPLACNGELTPRLEALPKERQTIYLRFLDFKAKVCRPFAQ